MILNPLIVYPDERATEISVNILRPDGSAGARSFPLTPLPGSGLSYWLDPLIERVSLHDAPFGFELPLESYSNPVPDDSIEVFIRSGDSEASLSDTIRLPSEAVAIIDAPSSRSSWDFARRRVFCFGKFGTALLTIDAKGSVRASTILDNRPVDDPLAVAIAGSDKGSDILAIAGGDLLRLSVSKVDTLLHNCRATRPAWSPRYSEIWLFGGDLPPRRLCADGRVIEVRLPPISTSSRAFLWRDSLLISTPEALYNASSETDIPLLCVSVTSSPSRDRSSPCAVLGHAAPSCVSARLFASSIKGTITLSGHRGSGNFGNLASLSIDGALNGPLRHHVIHPRRPYLRLTLEALASPDLALRSLSLASGP